MLPEPTSLTEAQKGFIEGRVMGFNLTNTVMSIQIDVKQKELNR